MIEQELNHLLWCRSGGSIGMMSPPLMSTAAFDNPNFACFFSLLRDKFRLSIDYKMSIEELEEVVAEWENLVGKCLNPGILAARILLLFLSRKNLCTCIGIILTLSHPVW